MPMMFITEPALSLVEWMVPKIKFHASGSFLVGPVINAREDRWLEGQRFNFLGTFRNSGKWRDFHSRAQSGDFEHNANSDGGDMSLFIWPHKLTITLTNTNQMDSDTTQDRNNSNSHYWHTPNHWYTPNEDPMKTPNTCNHINGTIPILIIGIHPIAMIGIHPIAMIGIHPINVFTSLHLAKQKGHTKIWSTPNWTKPNNN